MTDPPTSLLADNIDPSDLAASDLVALIEASQDDVDTFLGTDDVQDTLEEVVVTPIRERPNTLTGTTQRIQTGYDHIYVNINTDVNGRPVELFTTYGQSGGFTKSMTEAIHNLVTLALRSNAAPEAVVDQLRGIRSPKIGYDHGTRVDSIPDAIGLALDRVLNGDLPETIAPEGLQSSLSQHADVEQDDSTQMPARKKGGHEAVEEPASPDGAGTEGRSTPDTETDEEDESAPTAGDADDDLGALLDAPEEVSVSGEPDPQLEPAATPDAEPGIDPHLEMGRYSAEQDSHHQPGDTEPCPDCGSIDIYYLEGCKTCQDCGRSECG